MNYLVKLYICSWRGRNHGVRNTRIYSGGVEGFIMELRIQGYTVDNRRVYHRDRDTGIYSGGVEGFIMELGIQE